MTFLRDIIHRYAIYLGIGLIAIITQKLNMIDQPTVSGIDFIVAFLNIASLMFCCLLTHTLLRQQLENVWVLHVLTILIGNTLAVLLDFGFDRILFSGQPRFTESATFATEYLQDLKYTGTYWFFASLIDHFYRLYQNKEKQSVQEKVSVSKTGFLRLLPPDLADFPDVIEAQENYINIYFGTQKHTLLYRFKEAVAEMGDLSGLQVHRSFWVRTDAIASFNKKQGRGEITMTSGQHVPVSRTYLKSVESLIPKPGNIDLYDRRFFKG